MSTKTRSRIPGSRPVVVDQIHQVRPQHRGELQGVAVGELPEQLTERGWGIHAAEQSCHAARTHHIEIVDAVRADGHPGDDRRQLPGRVRPGRGHPAGLEHHPLPDQLRQVGLLGQTHQRDQSRARDQPLVVEDRDRPRPTIL